MPPLPNIPAEDAAAELLRRRRGRRDFLGWCEVALEAEGLRPARHHRLVISELQGVADRETDREMIFAPPGSAKSTYTTVLFPPYLFRRYPGCQVIGASHTSELAEDFSLKIQARIRDNEKVLGYGLATENRSRWYTTNGGCYMATGAGGAISGFRADFIIIDDPIKDRKAADSDADRKTIWDWYNGALERRRKPGAPIILMHTRWHEDDLAGRLLATEAPRWRVLKLPAQAVGPNDPLGRAPGEWLWDDDDYGYVQTLIEDRDGLLARGASREWAAQYQQEPRPADGIVFKTSEVEVLPAAPPGGAVCRAWDLAATKDRAGRDPDWTRGVKLQRTQDDRYVVQHVVGVRGGPEEVERAIVNTAQQDGARVKVGLPQDPGQAGKSQVLYLTKKLAGYTVVSSPETGDKATRAGPVASQCNVGNLAIVEGPWNVSFLDELSAFPAGSHDDQVDALSRAFDEVGLKPVPFYMPPEMMGRLRAGMLVPSARRRGIRV